MLNINLCSFWLLHLFIRFLRSWKPLNHLYHQHSWWVILKELKCIFICLWYHIMMNFYQRLSPLSFLQFVDCWIWCWLQEEGEDDGRGLRMGKRLLRSLALVFGCIALSSLVWDVAQLLIPSSLKLTNQNLTPLWIRYFYFNYTSFFHIFSWIISLLASFSPLCSLIDDVLIEFLAGIHRSFEFNRVCWQLYTCCSLQ